ncbi:hypothetical protein LIER_27580 [Lithospermum erythrorhizon]|uniref:Uncharacterized protein n=1 Tax=Lithospermum erythrorhizon TaxID=34254 RepID=A0AAV3RCM1_LITER
MMKTYTPIEDVHQESAPLNNPYYEETTSSNSCGCFNIFCFGWKNKSGQPQNQGENNQETWLVKKLKSLKETSEVVAGPKWKNLVRKMGKYFGTNKKSRCQFQYDPQSYQSNFDHGVAEEEDGMLLDFSSRFAPAQRTTSL